jgi:hypothetical protein
MLYYIIKLITLFIESRHWSEVLEQSTSTQRVYSICIVILLFLLHLNFPSGHSLQEFFMRCSSLTLPRAILALPDHHHYSDLNVVR